MLRKNIYPTVKLPILLWLLCVFILAGCSSVRGTSSQSTVASGSTYPDAVPRVEALMSGPNKPYTVRGKRYVPDTREIAYNQKGVASWYGTQFHGKPTSSGEIFDMYQMTAAHKTLPIPSYVHVTNVKNGRSAIVRVNDRGPFSDQRLIDLSYAAASSLGFVNDGLADVIVKRILPADIRAGKIPATTANPKGGASSQTQSSGSNSGNLSGGYFVQIGSFGQKENADSMQRMVLEQNQSLSSKVFVQKDGGMYKVYAGPYASQALAQQVGTQIESRHFVQTLLLDRR